MLVMLYLRGLECWYSQAQHQHQYWKLGLRMLVYLQASAGANSNSLARMHRLHPSLQKCESMQTARTRQAMWLMCTILIQIPVHKDRYVGRVQGVQIVTAAMWQLMARRADSLNTKSRGRCCIAAVVENTKVDV